MLNIIPDDNMVLERQSSYQKNKIIGNNNNNKTDNLLSFGGAGMSN